MRFSSVLHDVTAVWGCEVEGGPLYVINKRFAQINAVHETAWHIHHEDVVETKKFSKK
jgi:hypothetical protein